MSSKNTQFSIAVHLMAGLGANEKGESTSGYLAGSVNASPSFVRRILAKLSKVGLVRTTSGKLGSCSLAKKPEKISLYEIYDAVEAPKAFAIHEYPEKKSCPISCGIKKSLNKVLEKTSRAAEKYLKETSLETIIQDIKRNQ